MRILLPIIILSVFQISCQSRIEKNKFAENPHVQQLDSAEAAVSEALTNIENFPMEDMKQTMIAVEEYYTFFMNTDYTLEREVYLKELDVLDRTRNSFMKVSTALPSLKDEADLAYKQLEKLRLAFEHNQITEEEFISYLDEEMIAVQNLMFNYQRRVEKAMNYLTGFDTLVPILDERRKEAETNPTS